MLETGDKAPDFTMPTDGEGEVSLASLKGKKVVLYFYPKDNTPGCTTEAIEFSAKIREFDKIGAVVIGVSRDTVKKHANFREKHDLSVILGADEDGSVCEAYGVWVEKMNYGRKYMGIERSTFLIDGTGVIRTLWRKVKVKGHADAVLEAAGML